MCDFFCGQPLNFSIVSKTVEYSESVWIFVLFGIGVSELIGFYVFLENDSMNLFQVVSGFRRKHAALAPSKVKCLNVV